MSQTFIQETVIRERGALVKALENKGLKVQSGNGLIINLYNGTVLGDVIVKKEDLPVHCYGDLGYVEKEDGSFKVFYDDYLERNSPGFINGVNRAYSEEVINSFLEESGFMVQERQEEKSTVKILATKY